MSWMQGTILRDYHSVGAGRELSADGIIILRSRSLCSPIHWTSRMVSSCMQTHTCMNKINFVTDVELDCGRVHGHTLPHFPLRLHEVLDNTTYYSILSLFFFFPLASADLRTTAQEEQYHVICHRLACLEVVIGHATNQFLQWRKTDPWKVGR